MADRRQRGPTRGRGARTLRLGQVAAGGAVRWASDRVDGRGSEEDRRRRRGDRLVATIDALVDQLQTMRGAAMKAGQVLSTVEFPGLDADQAAHLKGRLASLRDDIPPVDWNEMGEVISGEWGDDPERILASIDHEPAAAASIGQVYRGQTREGRDVAIKVQYPGIAEAVESDMRNLRMLAPVLRQPDARPRREAPARRARRADRRRMRLRARGVEPSSPRPLLARPSVHRGPGRRHAAEPPQGAGQRVGRRDRLR